MPRPSRWRLAIFAFLLTATAFLFHWLGALRQLARSTFFNTVSLQVEEACLRSYDVECLRASWKIREATATMLARGRVGAWAVPRRCRWTLNSKPTLGGPKISLLE